MMNIEQHKQYTQRNLPIRNILQVHQLNSRRLKVFLRRHFKFQEL